MVTFQLLPASPWPIEDVVGFIPEFLSLSDPRPAKEQIHENYAHGGGWNSFSGFALDETTMAIKYPGDPELEALAFCRFRDETIIIYPHAWTMIIQPSGEWEIARLD